MYEKRINKIDVISIAVGSIIGTGAFLLPGDFFLKKIGLANSLVGIVIGILLVCIIEKNYSLLINTYPKAGGEYIFVKNSIGPLNAFICGWLLALSYFTIIPLNATALPIVINTVFDDVLKFGFLYSFNGNVYLGEIIVSIFVLILFALFNISGIKLASIIQNIMVLVLTGVVILFSALVLIMGTSNAAFAKNLTVPFSISSILKVLSIAPFLFIGFDCIPQIAEELNFGAKKISRLAIFSISLGGLLYICLILLTACGVTPQMLMNSKIDWAAGYSVGLFFGKVGIIILGIAFLMAIIAGINGFYMACSRLVFAMADEGDLPKIFSIQKNSNPVAAIAVLCVLSIIVSLSGRNTVLWALDVSSVGAALAYFYTSLSAYRLLKNSKSSQRFSVFYAVAGMLISVVFLLLLIIPVFSTALSIGSYITLCVWTIIGIIFKLSTRKS